MAMTWTEWRNTAEHEAARSYGKDYRGVFLALRFAGPVGVLALAGGLGFAGWWLWNHAAGLLPDTAPSVSVSTDTVAVPSWLWAVAVVLLAATAFAFRPGRIPSGPIALLAKYAGFTLAWVGLIGFTVGALI